AAVSRTVGAQAGGSGFVARCDVDHTAVAAAHVDEVTQNDLVIGAEIDLTTAGRLGARVGGDRAAGKGDNVDTRVDADSAPAGKRREVVGIDAPGNGDGATGIDRDHAGLRHRRHVDAAVR